MTREARAVSEDLLKVMALADEFGYDLSVLVDYLEEFPPTELNEGNRARAMRIRVLTEAPSG
jgi:hypothetical protein